MKEANISGKVRKNLGRGRKLGFPTANISLKKLIPEGIYAGTAKVGTQKKELPSLIFIGAARTFGETKAKAEVYILEFNGNLYGKKISVRLMKKLRGNKKFPSSSVLIKQMKKDLRQAKKFFKERKMNE